MFGFDPAALSAVYILAGLTQCPQQGPVDVDVQMKYTESPTIVSMSAQELDRTFRNDTSTTFASDSKWLLSGLTKSKYQDRWQAGFTGKKDNLTHVVCMSVNKIQYDIIYSPEVYIASDFTKMGCRYSATVAHEKRHVDADIQTITDYIPEIKKEIVKYFERLGPQQPFNESDVESQKRLMIKALGEALKPTMVSLDETRRKRQAEIDTPQVYKRDTALCPGQYPKFPE